jgi:hypothetical protein
MFQIKNKNSVIQKPYNPQYFAINNSKLLFFDIIYKNNKIYLIMPIYNIPANPDNIIVSINNAPIKLTESHVKDSNEPILIYIYEYNSPPNSVIKVNVSLINSMIKSYELSHIYTVIKHYHNHYTFGNVFKNNNNFLALTTLFKHDYYLFPLFYNYYKSQGVQHFYMYYNGNITPEISKIFNKSDVTLVEWNFHYWNPRGTKYAHHAQMGQMHHALYKYGKDVYDYMIFCDLDEYLHIPKNKFIEASMQPQPQSQPQYHENILHDFIKNNSAIDVYGFCNIWANTINDTIPDNHQLPNKFLTVSTKNEYKERSKNIYKVSSINTIGVHQTCTDYIGLNCITDLNMYHFYKWSSKNRVIDDCTNMIDLSL